MSQPRAVRLADRRAEIPASHGRTPSTAAGASDEDLEVAALALVIARITDPEGLRERADRLVAVAEERGLEQVAALGRLSLADALQLTQRLPEALHLARETLAWAADADAPLVAARAHAVLARALDVLGERVESLVHAGQAMELLDSSAPLVLRADHAALFAELTCALRPGSSLAAFEYADELANQLGEPSLMMFNLNNRAWVQYEAGDVVSARRTVDRLTDLARESGVPLRATCVDTVARVLMECGELAAAEAAIASVLDGPVPDTNTTGLSWCLLTLAEIKRRVGDSTQALRILGRCRDLTEDTGPADVRAMALHEMAKIFAEIGDYRAAYEAMATSHQEWRKLRSEHSEVTASSLHTLFETERARQQSREYQEMAERDSLTGLWNRRHLDQLLPALIEDADHDTAQGRPGKLSVALVDLDHFKYVNDDYSHDIGDCVLRAVGHLLDQTAQTRGFAVRLGGEEFLLVLPAVTTAEACTLCERFRLEVEAYPWSQYADGLTVTASVGIATWAPGDAPSDLLQRADEMMYQAKRSGRNQVIAGPGRVDRRSE